MKGLRKRKGSPYWWMTFTVNGSTYRRSTGTADEKEARKIYSKVHTQINEGKWFEYDEAQKHTFDEMMERYLREYSKVHKAEGSYKKDLSMKNHLSNVFSGLALNQITPRLLNDYKAKRLTDKAAPATVRNELRMLCHAFNVAMKQWEWTKENPVSRFSFKGLNASTIDRWLTSEEEKAVIEKAEGKLYGQLCDIIVFALNTGMSQEEILKLSWNNVDLFAKTIITTRKKTGKTRTIPINNTVLELLKQKAKIRHIKGCYVFFNSVGGLIDASKLKKAFLDVVREAGIAHCRFHDLRHTFATRLVQNGKDLYKVSKLLGHADVATTQRYAHHYPESLRDAVDVLDRLNAENAASEKEKTAHFLHSEVCTG